MRVRLKSIVATMGMLSLAAGALAWGGLGASSPAGAVTGGPVSPDVPYSPDAQSLGGIHFFDANGNAKITGSIDDKPFAAKAVADGPGVNTGDTKATLFIYTPVQGKGPADWDGNNQLSLATTYVAGTAATAAMNVDDISLNDHISDITNVSTSYPGLYELRLMTSFPSQLITTSYYSADIKVTGTTWTLVNPVPVAAPAAATTTTLTATPPTGATTSTSVSLSASVAPAAAGTVQFKDGGTNIGSVQTIAAGGTASINQSFGTSGAHSLTAVFTPANPAVFVASTGALSYTGAAATV
jgi:hypothetical protein